MRNTGEYLFSLWVWWYFWLWTQPILRYRVENTSLCSSLHLSVHQTDLGQHGLLGCSMQHPPGTAEHATSLSGCCFLLLPHTLNPFNSFVSYALHSFSPTKVLPNRLLKPAQFIFYTAFLFPTLLKGGKLGLENAGRKARGGPHHSFFAIEWISKW